MGSTGYLLRIEFSFLSLCVYVLFSVILLVFVFICVYVLMSLHIVIL